MTGLKRSLEDSSSRTANGRAPSLPSPLPPPPPSSQPPLVPLPDSDPDAQPAPATRNGTSKSQSHLHSPTSPTLPAASSGAGAASSSFRNVSACNRCRVRKNRCDQRLPACAACEKAHVRCVGFDPITKREIPRSYVHYLETRIAYLESTLHEQGIPFAPAEDFTPGLDATRLPGSPEESKHVPLRGDYGKGDDAPNNERLEKIRPASAKEPGEQYDREKLNKLVSNIGMVSVQGASDPRFLGSTSGISFARVVFAAVRSSVSGASSDRGSIRGTGTKPLPSIAGAGTGTTMRDSFFGLQTKPTIRQAPFPDRDLGLRLVELYFEHANPQIPILHRGEFMALFERAYAADAGTRTPRESYMLNIVFAIGAGIIMGSSDAESGSRNEDDQAPAPVKTEGDAPPSPTTQPSSKRRRIVGQQHQPEEYHASAIVHLESFLGSSSSGGQDRQDSIGGGLEELQAVLLLAGFALLRPVAPGLWYIVGVAVRLGVDLGLHFEDGVGIDVPNGEAANGTTHEKKLNGNEKATAALASQPRIDSRERGRRQWVRDLRRRLWWCVYSFDRLVSTCVGRPFGITDQVVTTEFPSVLEDKFITKEGFLRSERLSSSEPSYKLVAYHYFRLRLLQSEILQVLQHRQAQQARALVRLSGGIQGKNGSKGAENSGDAYMHASLPSPFLAAFGNSFRNWRADIDRRLREWKDAAPRQEQTGVAFSPLFLDLNYWQAIIMLYRQSLTVPAILADEMGDAATSDDVASPSERRSSADGTTTDGAENGDSDDEGMPEDEDRVYLKVAEAGQRVLKLYRQLHRVRLVNYTFLATHHLFMAGISFLYAIWHSPVVRSHLTLDDVDFTVLAATSVLGDLIEKCPPAEACRDAFDRMSKATIQMCMTTTGFGPQALAHISATKKASSQHRQHQNQSHPAQRSRQQRQHQKHVSATSPSSLAPQQQQPFPSPTSPISDRSHSSNSPSFFPPQGTAPKGQRSQQHHQHQHHQHAQPRFDMSLRDLFADDDHTESFGNRQSAHQSQPQRARPRALSSLHVPQVPPPSAQYQQQPHSAGVSRVDLQITPRLRSYTASGSGPSVASPDGTSTTMGGHEGNNSPYALSAHTPSAASSAFTPTGAATNPTVGPAVAATALFSSPDLSFLSYGATGMQPGSNPAALGSNPGGANGTATAGPGFDAFPAAAAAADYGFGFGMGMGMGLGTGMEGGGGSAFGFNPSMAMFGPGNPTTATASATANGDDNNNGSGGGSGSGDANGGAAGQQQPGDGMPPPFGAEGGGGPQWTGGEDWSMLAPAGGMDGVGGWPGGAVDLFEGFFFGGTS